jgi:uncharacterized membrane protein YfcA
MFDLNWIAWIVVSISSLLVGISKTGVMGVGILAIPLMASVLPARASVGVMLPMLIFADVFAAAYYRHHAHWRSLVRIIPWALLGVVFGYLALGKVNDRQLRPLIGGIVMVILGLNWWRERNRGEDAPVPTYWWFAAILGLFAGITTMMANAAGPIMVIYLVAMRLPKTEFVGTSAWYFFIMNWLKVPFSANLGLINAESLRFNLMLFPLIAVGAVAGILILKRIPQKVFTAFVQFLAALAGLHLLFSPLIIMFTAG